MPGPKRHSYALMDPLYGTPWAPDPRYGQQPLRLEAPPMDEASLGWGELLQKEEEAPIVPKRGGATGLIPLLGSVAGRRARVTPESQQDWSGGGVEAIENIFKDLSEPPQRGSVEDIENIFKDLSMRQSLDKMRQIIEDLKSGRTGAKPRADLAHIGRSVAAYNAQQRRKRRRGGGGGVAEGAGVEPTFAERVKRTMTPEQMHTDDFSDLSDIDWPESPEPTSGIGTAGALGALSIPLLALLGAVALSSKKKEKRRFRRTRRGKRIYRDDG